MGRKITRKSKQSPKKQKPHADGKDTGVSQSRKNSTTKSKKRAIITLSDSENEIDALLEEFKEEEMNFLKSRKKSDVVLSSDDEEMENLLEEFIDDESNAQHNANTEVSSKDEDA